MWQPVKSLIRKHRSLLITTHVFPDGDAVGSALALGRVLRKLGKKVLVVTEHPVPKIYRFLDPAGTAKRYTAKLRPAVAGCDAAFVVDVASLERVGRPGVVLAESGMPTACIDHHATNAGFADVNAVDRTFAATGEMVWELARSLRVDLGPRSAAALFTAVATDTGWFRFSNTTARTHRIAADLIEHGARPERIYEAIHETHRWQRLALMRRVLETLRSDCGGRLAYFHCTEKMLRDAHANHEDAEGFTDIPRILRGVKLILFFREAGGRIKVSLRSKNGPSVDKLARSFGGGGHAKAAGIVMDGPLRTAMNAVLAQARKLAGRRPRRHQPA